MFILNKPTAKIRGYSFQVVMYHFRSTSCFDWALCHGSYLSYSFRLCII